VKKQPVLVTIRDVNAQLVRPGCSEPISIQAFYARMNDHGFKSRIEIVDGHKRACITEDEARELTAQFEADHAKRRRRIAKEKP
jgi:hypothetical protein